MNKGLFSRDSDLWRTPPELFAVLDRQWNFDLDVCAANAAVALCPRFYSPREDGLMQTWGRGRCWMNPPYSAIDKWIAKAHGAALGGALVVALVPARTDPRWMWQYGSHGEILLLPGRLKFIGPSGIPMNSAPFPSAVIVFRPKLPRRARAIRFWDWRAELRAAGGPNNKNAHQTG